MDKSIKRETAKNEVKITPLQSQIMDNVIEQLESFNFPILVEIIINNQLLTMANPAWQAEAKKHMKKWHTEEEVTEEGEQAVSANEEVSNVDAEYDPTESAAEESDSKKL